MIGTHVRLAPLDPDAASEHIARWRRDSEYARLLDAEPQLLRTAAQMRRRMEEFEHGERYGFLIRTLADDRIIGFVNMWPDWMNRDVWIGIGIGDAADRGKGYGTDAMRLALRFAFEELEMDRASLGVYADNERAWRSYQRAGFVVEGRQREMDLRDGRRWDDLIMGILREEWRA
jgi:RimJ/RimL family protein N-acetyltransferase